MNIMEEKMEHKTKKEIEEMSIDERVEGYLAEKTYDGMIRRVFFFMGFISGIMLIMLIAIFTGFV